MSLASGGLPGYLTLLLLLAALATSVSAVIAASKGTDTRRRALVALGLLAAGVLVAVGTFAYWSHALDSAPLSYTGGNVEARMEAREAAQAAGFGPLVIAVLGAPLPFMSAVAAYVMSKRRAERTKPKS